MKMKNRFDLIVVMAIAFLGLFSCSGDSDGASGCLDPESVNFDADAGEDDGSCLYAADKITGNWQTAESMSFSNPLSGASGSGDDNYVITIGKVDNALIDIDTDRKTNTPNHDLGNFSFEYKVDWEEKTIGPLGLFSGEIIDEDHINIDYQLGLSEGLYTVKLELVRI